MRDPKEVAIVRRIMKQSEARDEVPSLWDRYSINALAYLIVVGLPGWVAALYFWMGK